MKYNVMSYSIHTIFQCLTLVYHLRVISADSNLTLLDINVNITFQSLQLNLSKVENLTAHILYPAYDRKLLSLCLIDCLYIIKFVITSLFWIETGKKGECMRFMIRTRITYRNFTRLTISVIKM